MNLLLIILALFVFGCTQNENSKDTLPKIGNFRANDSLNGNLQTNDTLTTNIKRPIVLDSAESLRLLKDFASAYNPPNKRLGFLPELNDSMKVAITNVKAKNNSEFKNYLTLIFIKLYRSNLRCCHQSYDLRKNSHLIDKVEDPLYYEFNEMTGIFPKGKRVEFFSSGLAEKWVNSNPDLLKNQEIKREMKIIERVNDSIEKRLYWK